MKYIRSNRWRVAHKKSAGQTGAGIERIASDAGDIGADRNISQAAATIKHGVTDAGKAVRNRDVGQASAGTESTIRDGGDAGGNCDAGQAGAVLKCPVSNAGDRRAVDGARDDRRAAGTGVSGEGDRAVSDRVSVGHCGCESRVRTRVGAAAIGGGEAVMIGRSLLQTADASAHSLLARSIVRGKCHVRRAAQRYRQAVFKPRGGRQSVRVHRA